MSTECSLEIGARNMILYLIIVLFSPQLSALFCLSLADLHPLATPSLSHSLNILSFCSEWVLLFDGEARGRCMH